MSATSASPGRPWSRPGYDAGRPRRLRRAGRRPGCLDAYAALAGRTTDPAALTAAHLHIHRALVGLTGSERLVAAADAYGAELRLGLAHLDRVRGNITEQVESHRGAASTCSRPGTCAAAAAELDQHLAAAEVSLHAVIGHGTIEP